MLKSDKIFKAVKELKKDLSLNRRKGSFREYGSFYHPRKKYVSDIDINYLLNVENISSEELKWRFDNEDRIIRPLNETNWQYQSDNQLPILLENNKTIYIPKGKYHRFIKGSGELKVEISTKGTY